MITAALLCVLVTCGFAAWLIWSGPIDVPRSRGLHVDRIPTAGGLAVMAGTCVAACAHAVSPAGASDGTVTAGLLAFAGLMGLMGAVDDSLDLGPLLRLGLQILAALGASILVGRVDVLPLWPGIEVNLGPVVGTLGTALWLIVVVNAFNFMDGSDGLAIGVQSLGLFVLALAAAGRPILAFALLAASVANLALLPFNHPGRRLFQGDSGAMFSSGLLGLGTVLLAKGPEPVETLYLGVFVSAPFLTDVLLTLLARARARRPLSQPHRDHLYQRWLAATGQRHGALAWRVWLLCGICGGIGYLATLLRPGAAFAVLAVLIACLSLGWVAIGRHLRTVDER